MNRRGIALLATLWLLAALSVIAAGALSLARIERNTAVDRVALTRGRFAAEGCLALLQGGLANGSPLADIDSTDLGGGVWCRASIEDLGARLSVEVSNAEPLAALIGDTARTAALLDWIDPDDLPRAEGAEAEWYRANGLRTPRNGPLADVDELRYVRGFDSAAVARLAPFLTKWSSTRVNVNVAPREILSTLPGLEPGAVELLLDRRGRGEILRDLDGMLSILPASLRAPALGRYAELQSHVFFTPERIVVHLEGVVPEVSFPIRTTILAQVASVRLAVLAREEW
jgi:general secretion pathway protein K